MAEPNEDSLSAAKDEESFTLSYFYLINEAQAEMLFLGGNIIGLALFLTSIANEPLNQIPSFFTVFSFISFIGFFSTYRNIKEFWTFESYLGYAIPLFALGFDLNFYLVSESADQSAHWGFLVAYGITCSSILTLPFSTKKIIAHSLILFLMLFLAAWARMNVFPLWFTVTPIGALFCFCMRIQQLRLQQSEVKRSYRLQQQIAAKKIESAVGVAQMVAHDVRKPFALFDILKESISTSQSHADTASRIMSFIPAMEKSLRDVDTILNDVIEMSRNEGQQAERKSTRLNQVLTSSLTKTFQFSENKDIYLDFALGHQNNIVANYHKIERVLINILSNAYESIEDSGTISISTEQDGSTITVKIANTGSIISEQQLQDLFKPYRSKNKEKGTGLGLAYCAQVIKSHSGRIWAHSDEKTGTSFSFTLPVDNLSLDESDLAALPKHIRDIRYDLNFYSKSENREVREHQVTQQVTAPTRVAYIEDDPFVRESWKIKMPGFEIETFGSPEDFLAVDGQHFDLIITDFWFDNSSIDGRTLATQLKQANPKIPVFLCTSDITQEPDGWIIDYVLNKKLYRHEELTQILESLKRA